MADNMQTFGAKFTIDITNLKSGISDANRMVRLAASEFKSAAAGMDDWKTSEDGLNAKLKQLSTTADAQRAIVDALAKKHAEVAKEKGEDAAETQNLAIRLNNAQAALNKTEKELGETKSALSELKAGTSQADDGLEEVEDSSKRAGNAIDDAGDKAKESGGKFSAAFGAIAGVAQSVTNKVIDAISGLKDEIIDTSDATDKFQSTLKFAGIDDTKIKQLTESTRKYADQTVYDLSDIQSTTAQLAANGVQGYAELAEAAGNLNAVAGGNADTYKSVAMVLTQTAGAGKLTTENWNQLADAIPGASGKLQEAMKANGAYTGNFRDAMEKGQISADEFNKAIMDLGFTDAAKQAATSTSTIEGAMGNLQASVVGGFTDMLNSVKPQLTAGISWVADKITAGFDWIKTAVSGLTEFVKTGNINDAFKTAFGGNDWSQSTIDAIKGIRDNFISFAQWVKDNAETIKMAIAGIVGAFAAFKTALAIQSAISTVTGAINTFKTAVNAAGGVMKLLNATMLANPFALVATAIGAVVAALAYFFTQTETGRQLWQQFMDWLTPIWNNILAVWQPIWQNIQTAFTNVWNALQPVVSNVLGSINGFIQSVLPQIAAVWQAGWALVQNVVQIAWGLIQAYIVPVLSGIVSFISSNMDNIKLIWSGAWTIISGAVTFVWEQIKNVVNTALGVIRGIIQVVTSLIKGDWSGVWNGIKQIVSSVWNGITTAINNAINLVGSIISGGLNIIVGVWRGAWNGIKSFFTSIWNGIKSACSNGINGVMGFFHSLPGNIKGVFNGAGHWLLDAGKSIIQGLWDGMKKIWSNITGWLGKLGDQIKQLKGPPAYDAVMLTENGGLIMQGLAAGMRKSFDSNVIPLLKSFNGEIASDFGNVDLTANVRKLNTVNGMTVPNTALANGNGWSGRNVYVTQNFYSPEAINARDAYREGRKLEQVLAAGV